jgi:pSer/pThr/pTyr-binding forkhead associated (FHA) protein
MEAMISCPNCGLDVLDAHRFCGSCGGQLESQAATPASEDAAGIQSLRGRLVRIHGGGADGDTFTITEAAQTIGRLDADICFADDAFISPIHATVYMENDSLYISDEQSLNGVFQRLNGSTRLSNGETFMAGEELLRIEVDEPTRDEIDATGTHFFGSPRPPQNYRVRQLLEGGLQGLCFYPLGTEVTIGREKTDLEFPHDRFISGTHCRVVFDESGATLTDLDSRNGTYIRISGATELRQGDFIFIGRQLMRVEIARLPSTERFGD